MRCPRLLLAVLLATACTGDAPRPDPDQELRDARARLAVLARATANGTYDAEYRFLQAASNTTGTIRIRQAPPQYRIDIEARTVASYFALTTGVVSCSQDGGRAACLLVAKPGQPVPDLFDPGVQRLFRDAVQDLAATPGAYLVTRVAGPPSPSATVTPTPTAAPTPTDTRRGRRRSASPTPPPPSSAPLPAGECFRVERVGLSPDPSTPPGFEDGTYCFAEQGVATSITVASGSLTLVRLLGAPRAAAFRPPAKVQPLPESTRSPKRTPTPSK